jgi:hypothetical protein
LNFALTDRLNLRLEGRNYDEAGGKFSHVRYAPKAAAKSDVRLAPTTGKAHGDRLVLSSCPV